MPALALAAGAVILLLILFLLASPTFRQAMHDTIAGVPLIGQWLADNNERLIVFLYGRLAAWANSATGALTSLIGTLADLEYAFASQLTNLASAMHESAVYLRYTVIPAAVTQAEAYAEGRISYEAGRLGRAVAAAVALAGQFYAASIRYSQSEYLAAVTYAERVGVWAAARADTLWSSAAAYTRGLFVVAAVDAAAREQRSEDYTAAAVAGAQALTIQALGAAERYAELWGRTNQGYARDLTLGAEQRADLQNAQTQAWTAGLVGVLAGGLAAVENSRCMQQCDTLGQIGEFASALDVGLLLAFVAEARAHPEAAIDFMRSQVAPTLKALGSDTEALVGG